MANTDLRDIGTSVIAGSEGDEEIIPALGNGVGIPGDLVSIGSDRKIVGADLGASELLTGILKESKITGTETAPGDGVPCSVVVPKSGRLYRIRILDQTGAKEIGYGLHVSATAYKATVAADVNNAMFTLARPIANGDTVATVRKT